MNKGERTRARITDAASALLRRRGYNGTGLNHIIAESGAPRGSLYFHFPGGKEELACAAIEESGRQWRAALEAIVDAAPSTGDAIQSVCEFLAADLEASDYHSGCPAATVALEVSSLSERVREACASLYRSWVELIADRLIADGLAPERARQIGSFVLSAIEGALLLARVERRGDAIRDVGHVLAEMNR